MTLRIARLQFPQQMSPFVTQLAIGLGHFPAQTTRANLTPVKPVSTPCPLLLYRDQIPANSRNWSALRSEPGKLRMMSVTLRSTTQHFLRQQCLAPERDEPFRIEITRMNCPESHQHEKLHPLYHCDNDLPHKGVSP
jgi:hypothetical protein